MIEEMDVIVDMARGFQNRFARQKDIPIQFIVRAGYENGMIEDHPVENKSADHLPPWYWPVLDQTKSVAALKNAIEALSNSEPETLTLIAVSAGMPNLVVGSLLDSAPPSHSEYPKKNLVFINHDSYVIDDIITKITMAERQHTGTARAVIVCAIPPEPDIDLRIPIEYQVDLDDQSLGAHQRYAMDGTETVLWLGTVIPNYPSPSRNDVAAAIKSEQQRTDAVSEIHILSGDVFDSGNGLAYIRSAHRIFTITAP